MSKHVAGLVAFLALLLTLLVIFYLGRKSRTDDLTWRKAYNLFSKAKSGWDKLFVVFLCLPFILRKTSYLALVASIASAGFICIAAVFGDPKSGGIIGRAIQIIKEVYPYIESLVR